MFKWNEELSVGIKSIDEQHKKLIRIINKLYDAMKDRKTQDILREIIKELSIYANTHFSYEQDLFEKHSYPAANSHLIQHQAFTDKISKFENDYKENKLLLSSEIVNFLRDWLIKHIKGMDKKYTIFLKNRGVK